MADLKAKLTVQVGTVGAERLDALSKSLERVGSRAAKAANDTDAKQAAHLARMEMRLRAFAAKERARQESATARAQASADRQAAAAERSAERRARAAERAAERERRSAISVENEMDKLARAQARRAARAEARQRLGLGDGTSLLAGHGFTSKLRQGLGLARDLTIAGMGMRFAVQSAIGVAGEVMDPVRQYQTLLVQMRNKGVKAQDLPAVDAAIRASARNSSFSPTQQAAAGVELAAAGLTKADQMEKALPQVLQFAQAGGLSTERSAGVLVETAAQFGMDANSFKRIGDAMKAAADASTVGVEDLAESMKYVGPVASAMGFDLEFAAGTMALLGENGLKGSQGGTAMRRMLTSLVHPAKQAKAALGTLGLSPDDLKKGLASPEKFQAFFADLQKRFTKRKMSTAQQSEMLKLLFGEEGITAGMILMKAATDKSEKSWSSFTAQMRDANGAMQAAADNVANTLDGKMAHLNSTMESAKITLGEKFVPMLDRMIPKLANAANATADWISKFSPEEAELGLGAGAAVVGGGIFAKLFGGTAAAEALSAAGMSFGATFAAAVVSGAVGYGIGSKIAEMLHLDLASQEQKDIGTQGLYSPADIMRREDAARKKRQAELVSPLANDKLSPGTLESVSAAGDSSFQAIGAHGPFTGSIEISLKAPKGMGVEIDSLKSDKPLRLGVNVGH